MCIIIYSPKSGEMLPVDWFNEAMEWNDDGMSLTYVQDGEFKIIKTLLRGDIIYDEYKRAHREGFDCIIHMRITTHGKTTLENCHPFALNENEVFFHNGQIFFGRKLPEDTVDTKHFGENILRHMPDNWRELPEVVFMLEQFLTDSKVVILNRQGEVTILNEKNGYWDKGIWFSALTYDETYNRRQMFGAYSTRYDWDRGSWYRVQDRNKSTYNVENKKETIVNTRLSDYPSDIEEKQYSLDGIGIGWMQEGRFPVQIVAQDDPLIEYYPDGFDYQSYLICTYCMAPDLYESSCTYPIFFNYDSSFQVGTDGFVCDSCNVWINQDSPKRKTLAFCPQNLHALTDDEIKAIEEGWWESEFAGKVAE